MERVFRLLFNVRELRLRCDDDSIDRLSKRYTVCNNTQINVCKNHLN